MFPSYLLWNKPARRPVTVIIIIEKPHLKPSQTKPSTLATNRYVSNWQVSTKVCWWTITATSYLSSKTINRRVSDVVDDVWGRHRRCLLGHHQPYHYYRNEPSLTPSCPSMSLPVTVFRRTSDFLLQWNPAAAPTTGINAWMSDDDDNKDDETFRSSFGNRNGDIPSMVVDDE